MSNASDFRIQNGRLEEYVGLGGNVVIPDRVTSIGSAFYKCRNLYNIILPAGVTRIDDQAFDGCSNLERQCDQYWKRSILRL